MHNFVKVFWKKYGKKLYRCKCKEKHLFRAVKKRNIHKIKKKLNSGVNVNCNLGDFNLLCYAVHLEDIEIIHLLLKHGAYANSRTRILGTPLDIAITLLNIRIVELLLTYGARAHIPGDLGQAVYIIDTVEDNIRLLSSSIGKIINHLLEFGVDINNYTLIVYYAIQRKDAAFLRMLLDYGADINLTFKWYSIPLQYSIQCGSGMCTEILLLHIMELRNSKKYVNPENLKCLETNKERCEELMIMREEFILPGKSYISLYDLLSKSLHQIMKYLRNEDVKQILQTINFIRKYIKYFNVLNYRVKKGIEKNKLFDDGHRILRPILDEVRVLPTECFLKIMSYLNHSELKYLLIHE